VTVPWLVLVLLITSAGPFRDFYQSAAGVTVIVVAGVLSAVGLGVMVWLARVPTEPRVLVGAGGGF
jgi:Flp pilus assembly protein TadB